MLSGWQSRNIFGDAPIFKIHIKLKKSVVPESTASVISPLGSFTCSGLSCSSLLCRLFTSWFCWASVPGAELFEVRSPSSGRAVTGGWPPTQDSAAGSFSKQTSEENDFLPSHWRWLTEGSCTCLSWRTRWLNSLFGVTRRHLDRWCLFTLCCAVVRIHSGTYSVCRYRVHLKIRHHSVTFWTRRRLHRSHRCVVC